MAVKIIPGTSPEARRELVAYIHSYRALECTEDGLTVLYIIDEDEAEMCRDMELIQGNTCIDHFREVTKKPSLLRRSFVPVQIPSFAGGLHSED